MARAHWKSVALLAGATSACGGERYQIDLSTLDDGIKVLSLFDDAGGFVRGFDPMRIEGGRRVAGPRVDVDISPRLRPVLFELEASVTEHPRGPVDFDTLSLVAAGETNTFASGTRFTLAQALSPSTSVLLASPEGGFAAPVSDERTRLLEAVELRQTIETDICRPPLEPFRPLAGSTARFFPGLRGGRSRVRPQLLPVSPRRWILLDIESLTVVDDAVPATPDEGSGPRRYLRDGDLGATSLSHLLALDDDAYLLLGREEEGGRLWTLRLEEEGFRVVSTSTLGGRRLAMGTRYGEALAVVDSQGDMWSRTSPDETWTLTPSARTDTLQERGVDGTPEGRLVRWQDELVESFDPGRMWRRTVRAPGRDSRVVSILRREDALWIGSDRGDLFVVEDDTTTTRYGDAYPLSLSDCAVSGGDPSKLHVADTIVGLVEIDGFVLAALESCAAVLSHRISDNCQSSIALEGDYPTLAQPGLVAGLYRVGDRILLATSEGALLESRVRR